jgi:hypothetical protein
MASQRISDKCNDFRETGLFIRRNWRAILTLKSTMHWVMWCEQDTHHVVLFHHFVGERNAPYHRVSACATSLHQA